MKKLAVVLSILCLASSASALPMPSSYPSRWYGEFLGLQLSARHANREGLRYQCESAHGVWGVPRDARRRNAGLLVCLRPTAFGRSGTVYQIPILFSFGPDGRVRGAATITVGGPALFQAWERESRFEIGSPRVTQRNLRAWNTFDVEGRPWHRILAILPGGRIGYTHVQGRIPLELLMSGDRSGP